MQASKADKQARKKPRRAGKDAVRILDVHSSEQVTRF